MSKPTDLIIDLRDGGDWSLDLCFAGLVKNGVNVCDVPYKHKHREWGIRPNTDWGLERRTLGYTGVPVNSREFDTLNNREWFSDVRRVWLDERMESWAAWRRLGLDSHPTARVVVVAGHDRFWNHTPEFVASLYGERLEAMLLDNWYERYSELPFKARRIGWSCNFDHYWARPTVSPEKDIDISFIGYNSHPDRGRLIDLIEDRFSHLNNHIVLEREPDSFGKFIPKSQYFDVIQRSKIALNFRGAADRGKTMRAYEIPYVGSFMLSQRIDDPGMTEDFVDLKHCVYFDSEQQLQRQIRWFLDSDPGHREAIAIEGHRRAIGELNVRSRWANVLQWLQDG